MTTISVLLPVFQAVEVIDQAFDNILGQTQLPTEIVLVDDGSSDGLSDRLDGLRAACARAGVALVCAGFPENRGRGAARNLALRSASGACVAWYDADDLWAPGKIASQAKALAELRRDHPENRLLLTCNYLRYAKAEPKPITVAPTIAIEDLVSVHLRRHIQLQTLFGPREAFLRTGLFDEALNRAEDFDFALRFAALGGKFVNPDPEGPPLVHYFRSTANCDDESEAANRIVLEKSREIFRLNHVDPDRFLATKLAALRRVGEAETPRAAHHAPAPAGLAFDPVDPGILPDGSFALPAGSAGEYVAHDAEGGEIGRGPIPRAVQGGEGLAHAAIVDLFMAGARDLDITFTKRRRSRSGRLRLLRAPSGRIHVSR